MDLSELWVIALEEADWIRYYGNLKYRRDDDFRDTKFYERIDSIGSRSDKMCNSLSIRISMKFITSDRPVLESDISDLRFVSGPRNHSKNRYTVLEYFIGRNIGRGQLVKIAKS